MGTRYRKYGRNEGGFVAVVLSVILALAVGAVAVWAINGMVERADMTRALELRVEHGDLCRARSSLSEPSSERDKVRKRLTEVIGEHNAILARHPTWTLAPIDSLCQPVR